MNRASEIRHWDRGFTLVELLVAMALMGAITAGVFSLYNSQHKVAHIEADVADVQQNLRMAMDSVVKDIRTAGFMLTGGENPIASIGNDTGLNGTDLLTLNTASSSGIAARIDVDATVSVTAGTPITFTAASGGEVDLFSVGNTVRVVNGGDQSQPAATFFTVSATDITVPSITITPDASAGSVDFKRGFLIVKTGESSDTFPNTILYCVGPAAGCGPSVTTCPANQSCLMRIVNGTPDDSSVAATNIQNLQFVYILDGSSAEQASTASIDLVRDVRVTVTGQTVQTAGLSGAAKTREITGASMIRNR